MEKKEKLRFCFYCGEQLPSNTIKFCVYCGTKLNYKTKIQIEKPNNEAPSS